MLGEPYKVYLLWRPEVWWYIACFLSDNMGNVLCLRLNGDFIIDSAT